MQTLSYKLHIGREESLSSVVPTNSSENATVCCVVPEGKTAKSSIETNKTLYSPVMLKTYTKGTNRYFVSNSSNVEFTDVIKDGIEYYYCSLDINPSVKISTEGQHYRLGNLIYLTKKEDIRYETGEIVYAKEASPVFVRSDKVGSYPGRNSKIFFQTRNKEEFVFRCNTKDCIARTYGSTVAEIEEFSKGWGRSKVLVSPFFQTNENREGLYLEYNYGRVVSDVYEEEEILSPNAEGTVVLGNRYVLSGSVEVRQESSSGPQYPELSLYIDYINGEIHLDRSDSSKGYRGNVYVKYQYYKENGVVFDINQNLANLKMLIFALPTKAAIGNSSTKKDGGIHYIALNKNNQIVFSSLQESLSNLVFTRYAKSSYYEDLKGYTNKPFANSLVIESLLGQNNYGALLLAEVTFSASDYDVIFSRKPSRVKYLDSQRIKPNWVCTLREGSDRPYQVAYGVMSIYQDVKASFNYEVLEVNGDIYTISADVGDNHVAPVTTNPDVLARFTEYDPITSGNFFNIGKVKPFKIKDRRYSEPFEAIPIDATFINGQLIFKIQIEDDERLHSVSVVRP